MSASEAKPDAPPPLELEFEFADMVKLACLLCARQFKSLDQLKRHNKESDLHKVSSFHPTVQYLNKSRSLRAFGCQQEMPRDLLLSFDILGKKGPDVKVTWVSLPVKQQPL